MVKKNQRKKIMGKSREIKSGSNESFSTSFIQHPLNIKKFRVMVDIKFYVLIRVK